MNDDEVEAWLARTRTAHRDHHLPHDADRVSLRARLQRDLDDLGVAPEERDAVVELCAAEMSRLFSAQAGVSGPDGRTEDSFDPLDSLDAHDATATSPALCLATAGVAGTATMPSPSPVVGPAAAGTATSLPRGWFRAQWRRLHWTGRVALVVFGPPVMLVLGLMALCTVSPPVGAAVLGTTNRVFDGELYGHDFVGFGKGRYETTPWQFTFLHPSRAAMDRLRVQCEQDPGFAPPVCATVAHSYRMEQHGATFTKVVDADSEQGWFEREACPALAVLDRRLYAKNPDAGWARYRSHGCVPYDA